MAKSEKQQILEKLQQVDTSVEKHVETLNRQLLQTRYYEQFTVNSKQGPITLQNVFITVEKDQYNRISYHFRWLEENGTIITEKIIVQDDGEIYAIPGLEEILEKSNIDFEKVINGNDREKGYLKGISEKSTPEQVKKLLSKEDAPNNEEKDEKDEETQEIENDLQEQGEDIEIGAHRKIKDDKIADIMPGVFDRGTEYEIAEDKKTNKYMIIKKENGKYTRNDKIEQGQTTMKKIFTIEPDGEQKESEIPDQLMRVTNDSEREISVTKDDYGDIYIKAIQVTPCQSRIGRSVQMENQGIEAQETKEVTNTFEQEGGAILADEIAHKKKELEEKYNVTQTDLEELQQLDIEDIMEIEARKAKVSKESFKKYVKKAPGKTLEQKINSAHEEIEQEYTGGKKRC